jgi:hypothetical protein
METSLGTAVFYFRLSLCVTIHSRISCLYPAFDSFSLFLTVMSLLQAAGMCCLVATASLLQAPSHTDLTQEIANVLLGELYAERLMTDNINTITDLSDGEG